MCQVVHPRPALQVAATIVAGGLRFVADDYAGPARSWRTAELSWVRGARRAHTMGDGARARKLAQAVVDRWRFVHEDVPAMAEMKQLLAKLPR